MTGEEVFRPRRPQQHAVPQDNPENGGEKNPVLGAVHMAQQMAQQAAEQGEGEAVTEQAPPVVHQKKFSEAPGGQGAFPIKGNVPPEFMQALRAAKAGETGEVPQPKRGFGQMRGAAQPEPQPRRQAPQLSNADTGNMTTNTHLKELLAGLKGSTTIYEEIELPSKGKFYDDTNGPSNGIVSLRPMTGEEEQILATPRFVRKGQAVNMIFQRCMKEQFRPESMLTIDRTYMLIYLRGISYSPSYDVEVKCPECEKRFATTIDLNTLYVEQCPDDYGPVLQDVLPTTKLPFSYRLSTGRDEQEIMEYRDRRVKMFGDAAADDTLTHRTAQLLDNIDGITHKQELQVLLKNLPISDVAYIRNCINEPPFGVDTMVEIVCPSCLQDFTVDLPLEANFFFPRRKKTKTQA
jgi:hypothetical protein